MLPMALASATLPISPDPRFSSDAAAPAILVTFAFRLVIAFKVFDEVYLLTGGGPGTATEVLSFTLFQRFFTEDRAGYGSAMAIAIIFLCSLLLVLALAVRRRSESVA